MNTPTPEDSSLPEQVPAEVLDEQLTPTLYRNSLTVDDSKDPLIGTTVAERYEILSVIGVGGWSVVYRAHDKSLNRSVAIKVLHAHLCVDQLKLQRFQREAEAASSLTHPNIAVIYDCGLLWAGRPYITMELIEGISLAEMIESEMQVSPVQCLSLFNQICEGIEAIHKLGLIHRDLKPSNIKISDTGSVKVLDFGLAKYILQDQNGLTKTDESVGTPAYMSPEQCLGKALDLRSDIYSLGCMMYEALAGMKPFAAENHLLCMQMQLHSMPPRFRSVRSSVKTPVVPMTSTISMLPTLLAIPTTATAPKTLKIPDRLEYVVFKALAKDPGDRFASVSDMKKELAESLKPQGVVSKLVHLMPWSWVASRKFRQRLIFASVCILVLGAAAIANWQQLEPGFRGLIGADPQRTIIFPDRPVGMLYLVKRNPGVQKATLKPYAIAKGQVHVPLKAIIKLENMPAEEGRSLEFLSHLGPNDLQELTLSNTALTDQGLVAVCKLKGLQSLNIDNTNVTDKGFLLVDLPALGGFGVRGTKITDVGLAHVASVLVMVEYLSLSETQITDKGAASLILLRVLRTLKLDHTKISDSCLSQIGQLPRLAELSLNSDNITDLGIAQLADVSPAGPIALKRFDLGGTKISDGAIDSLTKIRSLENLNVSKTLISTDGLARLRKALPSCTVVD